jgi:hypothetical protein
MGVLWKLVWRRLSFHHPLNSLVHGALLADSKLTRVEKDAFRQSLVESIAIPASANFVDWV